MAPLRLLAARGLRSRSRSAVFLLRSARTSRFRYAEPAHTVVTDMLKKGVKSFQLKKLRPHSKAPLPAPVRRYIGMGGEDGPAECPVCISAYEVDERCAAGFEPQTLVAY